MQDRDNPVQPLRPQNRLSFFATVLVVVRVRRLALVAETTIAAAITTSMAFSEGFEPRYFYDRAVVAELLLKDAIRRRSGDPANVLFRTLADEVRLVQPTTDTPCFQALSALVPVSLLAATLLAPERRQGPVEPSNFKDEIETLDGSWIFYREQRAKCARMLNKGVPQILPERLSEAF